MTAELAVTFPVVVLALAVVLLAGSLAQAGVSCADGARAGARALSRGEPHHVVVAHALGVVDRPGSVQVLAAGGGGRSGGLVAVRVSLDAGGASRGGGMSWRWPVTCEAHAWQEAAP